MSSSERPAEVEDWKQLALHKRISTCKQIPEDWLLPVEQVEQYVDMNAVSVLDVPSTSGIMTRKELDVTEKHDATDLIALMVKGELSSVEVVSAFCKRAAIAHQTINCLKEIMFNEALTRAHECDSYLKTYGCPIGPLHGLSVSLKDNFNVKGVHSTIGYVSFIANPPASSNSAVMQILFDAGTLFYVKTNIPQTMMTADSHNNVFGRTLNLHKLTLTAGGRTGGEAALIAMTEMKAWKPSLNALWDMNVQRADVLKKHHSLIVGEELDEIFMPGYQAVAPKHDTYGLSIYTAKVI